MSCSQDRIRHFTESPTSPLRRSKSGTSLSLMHKPGALKCEFVGSISAVNEHLCREGLSRHPVIQPLVSEQALTRDLTSTTPADIRQGSRTPAESHGTPNSIRSANQQIDDEETVAALVERYVFPGYSSHLVTPLPHNLDPMNQMIKTTKAQKNFKTKQTFVRYWKAIFLSDASLDIFVDIFWWFFLHRYQPQKKVQDLMFARVSENYIELLMKVTRKYSDFFFKVYPNVLAQCIYSTFINAFPTSWNSFDEEFKTSLCSVVYQWLLGLKPLPYIWADWNFDELEPKNKLRHIAAAAKKNTNKKCVGSVRKFDLETLITDTLREDQQTTPTGTHIQSPSGTSPTLLPNITDITRKDRREQYLKNSIKGGRPGSSSCQSTQPNKALESLSLPIKCPQFEHAVMDVTSHSPLVQYFMQGHGLHYESGYTLLIPHVDMSPEYDQTNNPTYREVIIQSQGNSRDTTQTFERAYRTLKEHMFRMEKERAQSRAHHRRDLKKLMRNTKEVKTLSNFLTVNQLCDQTESRRKQKAMIVITDAFKRVS